MEKEAPIPYRKDHRNELDTQTAIIAVIVTAFCLLLLTLLVLVLITIWNHRGYFGIVVGQMSPAQYRPTVINLLFPLLESVAVFVGFGATILQLRRAHLDKLVEDKWQRAQFVASEIRSFNSDQAVRNTKSILESILLGSPAIVKIEAAEREAGRAVGRRIDRQPQALNFVEVEITPQQLMNAFTLETDECFIDVDTGAPIELTPVSIRDMDFKIWRDFDEFMNYIINFNKLYRQGILLDEDIHPYLYYWFDIIAPSISPSRTPNTRHDRLLGHLQRYLKEHYDGPSPDRRDEGQCAFMCALLDSQGLDGRSRKTAQVIAGRYEINFAKIDILTPMVKN